MLLFSLLIWLLCLESQHTVYHHYRYLVDDNDWSLLHYWHYLLQPVKYTASCISCLFQCIMNFRSPNLSKKYRPKNNIPLEIMLDYSTSNQTLISSIRMPSSGSAVFVVCLMLDKYYCLNAHLIQNTKTVVTVTPWVWLNAVLYTGWRGIGLDVVRSSYGSIWGTTQHFPGGGGLLKKINNIFFGMTGYWIRFESWKSQMWSRNTTHWTIISLAFPNLFLSSSEWMLL
jgi:hypothetical protein